MSTITKFNISRELFPEYFYATETGISVEPHEFTHELEISNTVLQYKLSRKKLGSETADVTLHNIELHIDTLRNHNLFTDHCYFTFDRKKSDIIFKAPEFVMEGDELQTETVQKTSILGADLLSLFDKTYAVRPSSLINPAVLSDYVYMFPLRIFVPHIEATFNDCTIVVLTTNQSTKLIDTPDNIVPLINTDVWNIVADTTKHTIVNSVTPLSNIMATINSSTTVSSPAVGTTIPVSVTCSDTSVSKLYLEQVVGLLDRTQVKLTNGVGSFNVLTDTLASGDEVKVKIGYKKYSNVNTFTKTLA
jgi:hypothetical protein